MEYEQLLTNIGVQLLDPFSGAKKQHNVKCLICNHIWSTTPISITQSNKKHGTNGCSACNALRQNARKAISRSANLEKVASRGLVVLSDWDGSVVQNQKGSVPLPVTVRNINCGHEFTSTSKNLLTRGVTCPTCARVLKTANINRSNAERYDKWCETAPDWRIYKCKVMRLTRITYRKYKHEINPMGLPFGLAGVEGAHHLDHVKSIRWCYDNDIDERHVAARENLQVLPWLENIQKSAKVMF